MRRTTLPRRILALGIAALVSNAAQAQFRDGMIEGYDALPEAIADTAPDQPARHFFGYLGAAARSGYRYPGSGERRSGIGPMLFFSYDDRVYFGPGVVGGWLWRADDRSLRLGLVARVRGGIAGAHTPYAGVQDRRGTALGGVNLVWRTSLVNVGASWLHDIIGRTGGDTASLRLSHRFRIAERTSLTPSFGVERWSGNLVDYYYGVRAEDAGGGAPLYAGRATLLQHASLGLGHRLSGNWSLRAGLGYSRYGAGIGDSPLSTRRDGFMVYVGAGWAFRTEF